MTTADRYFKRRDLSVWEIEDRRIVEKPRRAEEPQENFRTEIESFLKSLHLPREDIESLRLSLFRDAPSRRAFPYGRR